VKAEAVARPVLVNERAVVGYLAYMAQTAQSEEARRLYQVYVANEMRRLYGAAALAVAPMPALGGRR